MADDPARQRRPTKDGKLMPRGRPWANGQSGSPRGPARKPRAVKDRAITDFVQQLNSLMSLKMEVDLMRESIRMQGEMVDQILSMLIERDAGGITNVEIMAKACEIARRETERRQQKSIK